MMSMEHARWRHLRPEGPLTELRLVRLSSDLYNSVLTHRYIHIISSASTPPNATKIAEMKDSHHGQVIVGPELLFSIYKCCFLEFVCAR